MNACETTIKLIMQIFLNTFQRTSCSLLWSQVWYSFWVLVALVEITIGGWATQVYSPPAIKVETPKVPEPIHNNNNNNRRTTPHLKTWIDKVGCFILSSLYRMGFHLLIEILHSFFLSYLYFEFIDFITYLLRYFLFFIIQYF